MLLDRAGTAVCCWHDGMKGKLAVRIEKFAAQVKHWRDEMSPGSCANVFYLKSCSGISQRFLRYPPRDWCRGCGRSEVGHNGQRTRSDLICWYLFVVFCSVLGRDV